MTNSKKKFERRKEEMGGSPQSTLSIPSTSGTTKKHVCSKCGAQITL